MDDKYFDREYLLLHNILDALRYSRMELIGAGTFEDMEALFSFNIENCHLTLTTLGGILNQSDDIPQGITTNKVRLKKSSVFEINYNWNEINKAIETLYLEKEVTHKTTGVIPNIVTEIYLTEQGLKSFNSNKYQINYRKERDDKRTKKSNLSANKWMKRFTGVIAASSLLTFSGVVYQICREDNKPESKVEQYIIETTRSITNLRAYLETTVSEMNEKISQLSNRITRPSKGNNPQK